MIWIPKHNPSSDPKFHRILILEGDGRETTLLFMTDKIGCVFIILIDILLYEIGRMEPPQNFVIFTIAIKTTNK
jgi:hypothetical protein